MSEAVTATTASQTITLVSGRQSSSDPVRDSANQVSIGGSAYIPAYIVARNGAYAPAIQGTQYIGPGANSAGGGFRVGTVTFRTAFELPANFKEPSLHMSIYVDDRAVVRLNGHDVGEVSGFQGDPRVLSTNDPTVFEEGTNVLEIDLVNSGFFSNPTALDYHATVTYLLNRAPVADAGGPYTGKEGSATVFDAGASMDPEGTALTYAWDFDSDGTVDATDATASFVYPDNGSYAVRLVVSDGSASDTATTRANIANVPSAVGELALPPVPVPVNTAVELQAEFNDPGILDTHTAVIDWDAKGISTPTPGIIRGSNGSGEVTGSHHYSVPGLYTVGVTVTDKDGGSGESVSQYVVVYDPEAGFATGAGWIDSPAGAYVADPTLTGRIQFRLTSRYPGGSGTPTGNMSFRFRTGDLDFQSGDLEWLVVTGSTLHYQGSGSINGAGSYGFHVTAHDVRSDGNGDADRLRVKIWDRATGAVVYDSQPGDPDDAPAAMPIRSGSIAIH